MTKIFKTIITVALALVCACSLFACANLDDSTQEKGLLCSKINGVYTIYKYVDEGENLTELDIASKLAEMEITDTNIRIQTNAFSGNATLEKIIVPSSVTKIEKGAFAGMKKLKEITLPFVGMTARADVFVGYTADDVENPIEKSVDAERTIAYIFGETEYAEGVKQTISYSPDADKSTVCYVPVSLKKITIKPQGDYNIPASAFNGLGKSIQIVFDGSIKEIGRYAFANMTQNSTFTLPTSVTKIHDYAFANSSIKTINLAELVALTSIGEKAFSATALTAVSTPLSLDTIGASAFASCASLKTVTLNNGLVSIARYGFMGCGLLQTVDTASLDLASLTVGDYAFADCTKLTGFDQTKCASLGVNALPSNP